MTQPIFRYGSSGDTLETALRFIPPTYDDDAFTILLKAALKTHPTIAVKGNQVKKLKKQLTEKPQTKKRNSEESFSNYEDKISSSRLCEAKKYTERNVKSNDLKDLCNDFEIHQEISMRNKVLYIILLKKLCFCEESDFTNIFLQSRKEFLELLPQVENLQEYIPQVMTIISRICQSESSFKNDHLPYVACNDFINKLIAYTTLLPADYDIEKMSEIELIHFYKNVIMFSRDINEIMSLKSRGIIRKIALSIQFSIKAIKDYLKRDLKPDSCHEIKTILEMCNQLIDNVKDNEKLLTTNKAMKETMKYEELLEPPNNIKPIDIFPTKTDLFESSTFLRKNVINGAYRDAEHYIDVQFRLLREDFIAPLRNGIQQYLQNKDEKNMPFDNIVIHNGVKILYTITIINGTFGHVISFSKGVKKIKKLMFGSLLLFTSNNFENFFCATVINPVNEWLVIVDIYNKPMDGHLHTLYESVYTVIETDIYFEPYYHVLKALQQIDINTFPMKKYIVDLQPNIDRVKSLSCMNSKYNLNESQQTAFEAALNNDFVAIQGPPGTGKTFLAKAITERILTGEDGPRFYFLRHLGKDYFDDSDNSGYFFTVHPKCRYLELLSNVRPDFHDYFTEVGYKIPPILIICYTNHALDQFLKGLLPCTKRILRVGGQSKNDVIQTYNLKDIRKCWVQSERSARKSCKCGTCKAFLNSPNKHHAHLENVKSISFKYLKVIKLIEKINNSGVLKMSELSLWIQPKFRKFLCKGQYETWLLQGMHDEMPLLDVPTNDDRSEFDISSFINELRKSSAYKNNLEMYQIDQFEVEADAEANNKFAITLNGLEKQIGNLQIKLEKHQSKGGCNNLTQFYLTQIEDLERKRHYISLMLSTSSNIDNERIRILMKSCNIWSLQNNDRWMLYHSWIQNYINDLKMKLMDLEEDLVEEELRYCKIQDSLDINILKSADIVGMTTTSAARLRHILQEVGPNIVIVEEAAEVLEAHIVASLTPSVKKVILIGDHKQLKPNPAVYKLARHYNLDISLFERMVNNGLGCQVLNTQHRMRPVIASLIVPAIYPELVNADKVYGRPDIIGIASNVFFVNHNHPEDEVFNSRSRSNAHEVGFLISLYQYLLQQHYNSSNINILATYTGQVTELERESR